MLLGTVFASAERVVDLGTANTINFRGEVSDASVDNASRELLRLDKIRGNRDYPIYLVIESPGGSIMAGENFIEVAKTIKNLHTITIFAASMASAIVEALPGERLILDSGTLMFHRAKGQVGGQFETGELESRLDFYKSFVRRMEIRNAERMKMSLKAYKQSVVNELWLSGKQCVDKGAADEIVAIRCTQKLIDKVEVVNMDFGMFAINLEFSGCALLKSAKPEKSEPAEKVELYNKNKTQIGVIK
jgi:ATP-dependent protease ClpP protease subunit